LKGDLKKQTQFLNGQNDAKSMLTMVYGDFDGPERRKNKANLLVLRDAYCGKIKKGPRGKKLAALRVQVS